MNVVGQVDGNQNAGRRGVQRHVVGRVVQELGPGVPFDVVRVVVAPPQLHVDPEFAACRVAETLIILSIFKKSELAEKNRFLNLFKRFKNSEK